MNEALIKQSKGIGYPDFLDIKVYEQEFQPYLESRYHVQAPSILPWLKSKLLYPVEMEESAPKQKDQRQRWFAGIGPESGEGKGGEVISPELVKMQEMLEALSKKPIRSSMLHVDLL